MGSNPSNSILWLASDPELADLARWLRESGLPVECVTGYADPDDYAVLVGTPDELRAVDAAASTAQSVAFLADGEDAGPGFEFRLRRPVHPAALKALLSHLAYHGPERRLSRRVAIGASVRWMQGPVPREAILVDLALTGCQLQCAGKVRHDGRLMVMLPPSGDATKTIPVWGRVVNQQVVPGDVIDTTVVSMKFGWLLPAASRRVRALMEEHAQGPARLPLPAGGTLPPAPARRAESVPSGPAQAEEAGSSAPQAVVRAKRESPSDEFPLPPELDQAFENETEEEPLTEEELAEVQIDIKQKDSERRFRSRHDYKMRVIARGKGRPQVLVGRDLSLGGMRVDPNPCLVVDHKVQLALHVGPGRPPLVVEALVARDDGDRGVVLLFGELDATQRKYLARMLDALPVIRRGSDGSVKVVSMEGEPPSSDDPEASAESQPEAAPDTA